MSRFVRASKYRHVFADAPKRENTYQELRISRSAWDSNLVSANPYFFSVNWDAGGGGAFFVNPHDNKGKIGQGAALFTGHSGTVLDTAFNPFNDFIIASASEDCTVKVWQIPEGGLQENCTEPLLTLNGHGRKVGQIQFHPVANNVLASTSTDLTLRLWDIEKAEEQTRLEGHTNNINDFSWSYTGAEICSVGKDKKLKIWDPRGANCSTECASHAGIKGSRCSWLGQRDQIFTTGYTKMAQREYALWDPRNLEGGPITKSTIDSSSGILMTFYDQDSGLVFLAGKGDGNIRFYEIVDEAPHVCFISEYKSSNPTKGACVVGRRSVDVNSCEIVKMMKLTTNSVEPLSFRVPRKADSFQADIFPDTPGGVPAITAEEWFAGGDAEPILVSLQDGFQAVEAAFVPTETAAATANAPKRPEDMTEAEIRTAYRELEAEKVALQQRVAALETELRVARAEN